MKRTTIVLTFISVLSLFFTSAQVVVKQPVHEAAFDPSQTSGVQAADNIFNGTMLKGGNWNGNPQGKPANYHGIIEAVDATSLTLTLKDGSSVTFVINSDTKIKVPTLGKSATVDDLSVGQKASVHSLHGAGDTLTARMILVVPGKPTLMHRVGQVSAYQAGVSITILSKDGESFTYLLTDSVKILPSGRNDQLVTGAWVTVIVPRDVTGSAPTAKGIVIHSVIPGSD